MTNLAQGFLFSATMVTAATAQPALLPWHVTIAAFCELSVDLHDQVKPHRYLLDHLPSQLIACPFLDQTYPVEVLGGRVNASCAGTSPDLRVQRMTVLTRHEYGQRIAACMGQVQPWLPISQRASGDVHLVTAPDVDYSKTISTLWQAEARSGLPIVRTFSIAQNGVGFLCFEMMPGAPKDLLSQLRALDVTLPQSASDQINGFPNCTAALKGKVGPGDSPNARVTITLRAAAGNALSGDNFQAAVTDELARDHLASNRNADGSYNPLDRDDPRPLVLTGLSGKMAVIDTAKLSEPICDALFGIMKRTQAFVQPLDDQSPTTIVRGTVGSQPDRYIALALQEVSSGGELCATLRPGFDRQSAIH